MVRTAQLLRIIFVLSVSIIFFIGGISYKHIDSLSQSSQWVNHTYDVTLDINKLYIKIKDLETTKRDYILSSDDSVRYAILLLKKDINQLLKKVEEGTKDNKEQQENIANLRLLVKKKYEIVDRTIKQNYTTAYDHEAMVENLLSGKKVMSDISIQIDKMIEIESLLLKNRQTNLIISQKYTPLFVYMALILTLALLTFAYFKMTKDLVTLTRSNSELKISKESNELAEEIGKFGIWKWDIEKNEYNYSKNIYKLLGQEPSGSQETLEKFMTHIHPDDVNYVTHILEEMIRTKNFKPFKYRIIRANDQSVRYFFANNKLIIDKDAKEYLLGCTMDITEEYLHQQLIEDRNRILEDNNKELQAFNYVASHDLQEPLRKIETFISRLVDVDYDSLSISGQQYLTRIKASASRMRILIDDLLQFSRTTRAEQTFEKADLNELLDNSKSELAQLIEDKKAQIQNDILPELKVIPFQIQQLFTNLIGNSLKYSKPDIAPNITISVTQVNSDKEPMLTVKGKEKFHKIVFQDNGIGFEQEYAEKIFMLFSRLHSKDEFQGTGIGLAICKKIVDNHKGYIFATGIPDQGAVFTVYLPIS